ncbi:IS481 family transposase, partial [Propionibacterium freudenreichii]|nr:IS481 family transposase [Propionibacterium freudenreichii]MDK9359891.1 IS481 family transposase [Propionibacterium freudenreichii]
GAPHALGVGAAHAGISTVITLDATTVTVIDPTTGQILSTHHIDPDRRYWPNTQRPPGRWPKHDP